MDSSVQISIPETVWRWWTYAAEQEGWLRATRRLAGVLWEFVRDSTPERLRQRFGDADYDWDYRVNTTSGAVAWRERLLGMFHSAYQPTQPVAFHEMIEALQQQPNFNFSDFTFIDLGSGKGRTLLMASDYPFRRILGVELLPALHQIAEENLLKYKSDSQRCFDLKAICADATEFHFDSGPLVLYLFNPLPDTGLRSVLANVEESLRAHPNFVYVLYHNPLLEHVLEEGSRLKKITGSTQYSLWSAG
jgi:SAM-dependent methyltransferase